MQSLATSFMFINLDNFSSAKTRGVVKGRRSHALVDIGTVSAQVLNLNRGAGVGGIEVRCRVLSIGIW